MAASAIRTHGSEKMCRRSVINSWAIRMIARIARTKRRAKNDQSRHAETPRRPRAREQDAAHHAGGGRLDRRTGGDPGSHGLVGTQTSPVMGFDAAFTKPWRQLRLGVRVQLCESLRPARRQAQGDEGEMNFERTPAELPTAKSVGRSEAHPGLRRCGRVALMCGWSNRATRTPGGRSARNGVTCRWGETGTNNKRNCAQAA